MNKTIYALGFFDGVHVGHAALLAACRRLADREGCLAGVVTFGAHPDTFVLGQTPALINSSRDREWLLKDQFHMDTVVTLPFDAQMRAMPWQSFVDLLLKTHNAAGFVCGEDFRFGYRGQGNAALMAAFCAERNLPCAVIPDQIMDGVRISSTYIRSQIETGDMATAVRFLGHPHILTGKAMPGQNPARKREFPTATLRLPEGLVVPRFGVYACACQVDGVRYPAVTNVSPGAGAGQAAMAEAWVPDYDGVLCDREIILEFHFFLRPEMQDRSQEQISRDIAQSRAYLTLK